MSDSKLKRVDLIFGEYTTTKYQVLTDTLRRSNEEILDDLMESGLRGRGGAGYPAAVKWKLAAEAPGNEKYVICNADEGEPGTFKDREILTRVPRKVLSGMTICGKVIGANKGFIYLRGEYAFLLPALNRELEQYHQHLKDAGIDFTIEIKQGSGAYICGEESALFESMEGFRGEPRNKPPYPTTYGYLGKPTVINNVETFVNVVMIMRLGPVQFKLLGTSDVRGSKVFSVCGDTPVPGIYELELGMPLDKFAEEFGDGDTKAVQVGGAAGFCVPRKKFNETVIGFEGVPAGGSIMLFNSSRSMYNVLYNYLAFFEEESCGQCTPCRVGCQQLKKGIVAVKKGEKKALYLEQLVKLSETMKITAKCGLGQSVANSFSSIVYNFQEEMIY